MYMETNTQFNSVNVFTSFEEAASYCKSNETTPFKMEGYSNLFLCKPVLCYDESHLCEVSYIIDEDTEEPIVVLHKIK